MDHSGREPLPDSQLHADNQSAGTSFAPMAANDLTKRSQSKLENSAKRFLACYATANEALSGSKVQKPHKTHSTSIAHRLVCRVCVCV
eukprot:4365238-Amphidinium_carterae.1